MKFLDKLFVPEVAKLCGRIEKYINEQIQEYYSEGEENISEGEIYIFSQLLISTLAMHATYRITTKENYEEFSDQWYNAMRQAIKQMHENDN